MAARLADASRDAAVIFRHEALKHAHDACDGLSRKELVEGCDSIRATLREGEQALALCGLALAARDGDQGAETYWLSVYRVALSASPAADWIKGRNPTAPELELKRPGGTKRRI